MAATTTGANNSALGKDTLGSNTTGASNVAVGDGALYANTTASNNTAVGKDALVANTTGASNTAVGYTASQSITTGASNTTLGKQAGSSLTTGDNNIAIGNSAMDHAINTTTGSQNIMIGDYTDMSAVDGTNQIAIGYNVTCVGNGNFTFGDGTSDSNIANGATTITAPSDVRLKEDIQDEEVGLDFINELRPVTFRWKKAKDVPSEMKVHDPDSEERVMNGKYNHGFVAQEVKEVIDRHDLKDGFDMWTEDEVDGRQRIGEASLMPMMVKAVQELSAKVEELEDKLK